MTSSHLNGNARDEFEASYVAGMQAVPNNVPQDERGRLLRVNIVKHFPEMEKVFAAINLTQ